jgi:hypothetical protein
MHLLERELLEEIDTVIGPAYAASGASAVSQSLATVRACDRARRGRLFGRVRCATPGCKVEISTAGTYTVEEHDHCHSWATYIYQKPCPFHADK